MPDRRVEEEVSLVLKLAVQILEDDIVLVRAEMSYRSIEELQLVLRADGLEPRVGCCI